MAVDIIKLAKKIISTTPEEMVFNALSAGDVQSYIVDLNTRKQLGFYEDSEGVKLADIGGEYSVTTQVIKGLGPREVNLNDKGDYWESFEVIPVKGADFYRIESNPFKEGVSLEDRWGEKLEGLQEKHKKDAEKFIQKKIIDQLANSLR